MRDESAHVHRAPATTAILDRGHVVDVRRCDRGVEAGSRQTAGSSWCRRRRSVAVGSADEEVVPVGLILDDLLPSHRCICCPLRRSCDLSATMSANSTTIGSWSLKATSIRTSHKRHRPIISSAESRRHRRVEMFCVCNWHTSAGIVSWKRSVHGTKE